MKGLIPAPAEVAREAIIVLSGALIAAFIVGQFPALKQWMREQWGGAPPSP